MPHVILKMVSGRSDDVKSAIAEAFTDVLVSNLGISRESVSVAVEDVAAGDWTEQVYVPDIQARPEHIFKQPGYDPFK